MNKKELAYLAGIVDGEGTISVTSDKASGCLFATYLSIANTSCKLLETIKKWVGAGCIQPKKGAKVYYKTCYVYTLRGDTLRKLLPELVPFLVVKKEQAKLLIKLMSLTGKHLKFYKQLHPEMFSRCQEIAVLLHSLNKKATKKEK